MWTKKRRAAPIVSPEISCDPLIFVRDNTPFTVSALGIKFSPSLTSCRNLDAVLINHQTYLLDFNGVVITVATGSLTTTALTAVGDHLCFDLCVTQRTTWAASFYEGSVVRPLTEKYVLWDVLWGALQERQNISCRLSLVVCCMWGWNRDV